jgi:predicted nucleic acid-binding Zn finger protein
MLSRDTGREIYTIPSEGEVDCYFIFKDALYCTCPAYRHKVIYANAGLVCKHILATRIAEAMGRIETNAISNKDDLDKTFINIFSTTDNLHNEPIPRYNPVDTWNVNTPSEIPDTQATDPHKDAK